MAQTRFDINEFSNSSIEIHETEISANPGVNYPRIFVTVNFHFNRLQDQDSSCTITNMASELYLKINDLKISDSSYFHPVLKVSKGYHNYKIKFEFPFVFGTINKVEEIRTGDLALEIRTQLQLFFQNSDTDSYFSSASTNLEFKIPRSHWVENILPSLNYGKYIILEIPLNNNSIGKAWNYIEKAEKSFNEWNSKDVYANCREAGTLLDSMVKTKFSENPDIKKWEKAFSYFNGSASLNLHQEDIKKKKPVGDFEIKKSDAEFILISTKVLYNYAIKFLNI